MSTRTLAKGQRGVLGTAAAGVVAAGEGLTLILALTMVGLTLLGQSAPAWIRVGLWLAPLAACGTGLALADNATESVVYTVTPLGMSAAAEAAQQGPQPTGGLR